MALFDKLKSFVPKIKASLKMPAFKMPSIKNSNQASQSITSDAELESYLNDFNKLNAVISEKKTVAFNVLEIKIEKAFGVIKLQLNDLHNSLDALAQTDFNEIEAHEKLLKAVQTSSKEVIAKINAISIKLEPINFKPLNENFESVFNYSQNSLKLLQVETMQMMKSVTYTGFILGEKIKEIGLKLKDLEQSFSDLNSFLIRQQKPKTFVELTNALNEISKLTADLARIDKLLLARTQELDELEKKSTKAKIALLEFKNSSIANDFVNEKNTLVSLKKQIEEKKQELAISLNAIHSLLGALYKISSTNHFIVSKELLVFLQKFSLNVSETLLENDSLLNQGVNETLNAITQSKLVLKEKQNEKALSILKEFSIDSVKPKILEIKQLIEKKSIIELKHQNNNLEEAVSKRKSDFEKGLLQLDFLKKEIIDLEKNISSKKQKLIQLQNFIKEKILLLDTN